MSLGGLRTLLILPQPENASDHPPHRRHSDRIGEPVFGTNLGLREMIGILLQDERVPGVHEVVLDMVVVGELPAGRYELRLDMVVDGYCTVTVPTIPGWIEQ